MAFTDRSDLFAAVHENGINATTGQLMLQPTPSEPNETGLPVR